MTHLAIIVLFLSTVFLSVIKEMFRFDYTQYNFNDILAFEVVVLTTRSSVILVVKKEEGHAISPDEFAPNSCQ